MSHRPDPKSKRQQRLAQLDQGLADGTVSRKRWTEQMERAHYKSRAAKLGSNLNRAIKAYGAGTITASQYRDKLTNLEARLRGETERADLADKARAELAKLDTSSKRVKLDTSSKRVKPDTASKRVNLEAAAKGGSYTAADSPAKAQALAALHEGRKGRHVNDPGKDWPAVRAKMAAKLKQKDVSLASASRYLGVSIATIYRWLGEKPAGIAGDGKVKQHLPSAENAAKVREWVKLQA